MDSWKCHHLARRKNQTRPDLFMAYTETGVSRIESLKVLAMGCKESGARKKRSDGERNDNYKETDQTDHH